MNLGNYKKVKFIKFYLRPSRINFKFEILWLKQNGALTAIKFYEIS